MALVADSLGALILFYYHPGEMFAEGSEANSLHLHLF